MENNVYTSLRAANVMRQKEWDPTNSITPEFRGNELAGEVGELCNLIKKIARERLGLRGTRATKEELEDEIGDVRICLSLLAIDLGIDDELAARKKFNKTSEKYGLATRIAESWA